MMGLTFFWAAVGVVIASLVMNWLVQLGYYFWQRRKNPRAFVGQKTLFNYYTGYLGDGIIVPLINVLIFYIIVRLGIRITLPAVEVSLGVGLVIDIVAHYLQGKLKLVNWSMPRPFQWNFAGYWHMVSFPIQMGYLLLFFWLTLIYSQFLWGTTETRTVLEVVWTLMALFVVLYFKDNNWLDHSTWLRANLRRFRRR